MAPKLRKCLDQLSPYIPAKSPFQLAASLKTSPEKIINLGSNENPLGASPKAIQAIQSELINLHLYPDPRRLIQPLSNYLNIPGEYIVLGDGIDGVLNTLMEVLVEPGSRLAIPIPSFHWYWKSGVIHGAEILSIPRTKDLRLQIQPILESNPDLVIIGSPNNPTGDVIPRDQLLELLELEDCWIILDEAYHEFCGETALDLIQDHPNLIIMRTFSKAFGLAGLRVGYAIMDPQLSSRYWRICKPYCLSRPAIAGAIAALEDEDHLRRSIEVVEKGREYLIQNLPFKCFPSKANFVLVDVSPFSSAEICSQLEHHGIIVRDCSDFPGLGDHFIRISVGTMDQNRRLVEMLIQIKRSRDVGFK